VFTFVEISSYQKKSRNVAERTARPLKRRYHGNQWSSRKYESDSSLDQSSASVKKLATADVDDVIRDPPDVQGIRRPFICSWDR